MSTNVSNKMPTNTHFRDTRATAVRAQGISGCADEPRTGGSTSGSTVRSTGRRATGGNGAEYTVEPATVAARIRPTDPQESLQAGRLSQPREIGQAPSVGSSNRAARRAAIRRERANARLLQAQPSRSVLREAGMATAEYAIATLAAVGFAALLVAVLSSGEVRGLLMSLITSALNFG